MNIEILHLIFTPLTSVRITDYPLYLPLKISSKQNTFDIYLTNYLTDYRLYSGNMINLVSIRHILANIFTQQK